MSSHMKTNTFEVDIHRIFRLVFKFIYKIESAKSNFTTERKKTHIFLT